MRFSACFQTRTLPLHLIQPSPAFCLNRRRHISDDEHSRHMSTKITSNIGKSSLEESKWTPPDDISEFMEFSPVNDHERKLIDYTNYLLSTEGNDYPVGSYPITHIMQISNCIDSWIASGEHRYLGAQQAELLVKRLIMERGGGRSLVKKGEIEFAGGNLDVTWDMYHLEPVSPFSCYCLFCYALFILRLCCIYA